MKDLQVSGVVRRMLLRLQANRENVATNTDNVVQPFDIPPEAWIVTGNERSTGAVVVHTTGIPALEAPALQAGSGSLEQSYELVPEPSIRPNARPDPDILRGQPQRLFTYSLVQQIQRRRLEVCGRLEVYRVGR